MELLEAHFVSGDLPEPLHQSRSEAMGAVFEVGLQVVGGSQWAMRAVG